MWDHIINIYPSKLLRTKTKDSRINEYKKNKNKNGQFYIFDLILFLHDFLKS